MSGRQERNKESIYTFMIMANSTTKLVQANDISKIIKRISHEIIESDLDFSNLALVGIKSRGDFIANRIADEISKNSNHNYCLGTIDVTFHRDDYRTNLGSPEIGVSDIKFDVNEKDIILIDDVLYTGRTIRAFIGSSLCPLSTNTARRIEFGRP